MQARTPIVALTMLALVILAGCGLKADPQPADLVRPETIEDLSVEVEDGRVKLSWSRPREYRNGESMRDLGGFLVFRGLPGTEAERVARIEVDDHGRFRKKGKFSWTDETTESGQIYYYRVISFTTDNYYSRPSNQQTADLE